MRCAHNTSSSFGMAWLLKGGASNAATQILSMALTFAQGIVIARLLGTEGRGIVVLLIAGLAFCITLFECGLGVSGQYHLVRRREAERTIISLMLVLSLGLGGLSALFLGVFRVPFARLFLHGVDNGAHLVLFILPIAPAMLVCQNLSRLMVSANKVVTRNRIQILQGTVSLLLTLLLVWGLQMGIRGAILAVALSTATAATAFFIVLLRCYGFSLSGWKENLRHLASYGFRYHGVNVLTLAFKRTEYFLLSYFLGVSSVGIYSIANSLVDLLLMGARSLQDVMVTAFAANTLRDSAKLAGQLSRGLVAVALVAIGPAALLGSLAIPLLYGHAFAPASIPFLILLFNLLWWGPGPYLTTFVASIGQPGLGTWTAIAVTLLNVGLSLWFIPRAGLVGNAVATVCSYGLNAVLGLYLFRRFTHARYRDALILTRADIGVCRGLVRRAQVSLQTRCGWSVT